MPGPEFDLLPFSDAIPVKVDVVIIGGGIIGLFTALELRAKGLQVAVCEKGETGAEQSTRNWGWVRVSRRDPREIPLVIESQRLWLDLSRRIQGDTGYERTGIVFTAQGVAERERQETWLKHAEPYQIQARMINRVEIAKRFPGSNLSAEGALFCTEDGRAEPQLALPALARAVRRSGVHILTHCAARSVETAAGSVAAVVTERGELACQSIVLAGGAWSSRFCRNLGIDLPQLKVLSSVLRTHPSAQSLDHALWTADFSVRKRLDGGFTVASGHRSVVDFVPDSFRYARQFIPALREEWSSLSFRIGERSKAEWRQATSWSADSVTPFEQERILDPTPADEYALRALDKLKEAIPSLADLQVAQIWAGMIDVTPDAIPVISPVESLPGFHLATGFSGHGFGIAPGAGRLMADLVTGSAPIVDPAAYRFSRFQDGSSIHLH